MPFFSGTWYLFVFLPEHSRSPNVSHVLLSHLVIFEFHLPVFRLPTFLTRSLAGREGFFGNQRVIDRISGFLGNNKIKNHLPIQTMATLPKANIFAPFLNGCLEYYQSIPFEARPIFRCVFTVSFRVFVTTRYKLVGGFNPIEKY